MTEKEAINVLMSLSIHVGGMEYPELRKYELAIEEIICWLFGKVPPTRSELEEAYDNGYRAAKADFYKAESDDAISRKGVIEAIERSVWRKNSPFVVWKIEDIINDFKTGGD